MYVYRLAKVRRKILPTQNNFVLAFNQFKCATGKPHSFIQLLRIAQQFACTREICTAVFAEV